MKKDHSHTLYTIMAIAGIVVSIAIVLIFWDQLPDRVPAHFTLSGEADRYAGKWIVWLSPAISLFIFFLLGLTLRNPNMVTNYPYTITPDTREQHYAVIRAMAHWLRAGIIWTFTYIELILVPGVLSKYSWTGAVILVIIAFVILRTLLILRRGRNIGRE